MKKIFVNGFVAFMLFAAGCGGADVQEETSGLPLSETVPEEREPEQEIPAEAVDDKKTLKIGVSFDYVPAREERIANKAIIRILTIDGGDTYYDDLDIYSGQIYSYGIFEVLKSIKGNLTEGEEYQYIRVGGTATYEQYAAGQNPESVEKQEYLSEKESSELPENVTMSVAGAVVLEEGKVYFAVIDDETPTRGGSHILGCFPEDFRIVDENTLDTDNILAMNNFTGAWEPVSQIEFPDFRE